MSLFDVLSKGFCSKKKGIKMKYYHKKSIKISFYMVMNILKENFMMNTYLEGCQKNSG